jgi:hypothetical protein
MTKTERDYDRLLADLQAIEKTLRGKDGLPLYLADTNVDRENVSIPESDPDYWPSLYAAAAMAAGFRAEEEGLNINDLLGYTIY